MKIQIYVLKVEDAYENEDAAVCNEMCDQIYMCGVRNLNNEFISFDDEAKHLKKWCEDNGLNYYCKRELIDV